MRPILPCHITSVNSLVLHKLSTPPAFLRTSTRVESSHFRQTLTRILTDDRRSLRSCVCSRQSLQFAPAPLLNSPFSLWSLFQQATTQAGAGMVSPRQGGVSGGGVITQAANPVADGGVQAGRTAGGGDAGAAAVTLAPSPSPPPHQERGARA